MCGLLQEFVRVGYYVYNEYPEEEAALREEPPKVPILEKCATAASACKCVGAFRLAMLRGHTWAQCMRLVASMAAPAMLAAETQTMHVMLLSRSQDCMTQCDCFVAAAGWCETSWQTSRG